MSLRTERELAQGKRIKENAEIIWGWNSPAGKLRADRRAHYFLKLTNMNAEHNVLEIGCGSGLFTEKVAISGAKITATDLSETLLELAKKKKINNCQVEQADVHKLKYPDSHFDIVFGSSVLHHLYIDTALCEICRVLKLNGQMVFAEPNMMNPQIFFERHLPFMRSFMHNTPDETAFHRHLIRKKLEKNGFTDIKVFPYDFLHPNTPVSLIDFVKKIGIYVERIPLLREIAGSLIIYGIRK